MNALKAWMKSTRIRNMHAAEAAIGVSYNVLVNISRGARDLNKTEALAMTAHAFGLQPWTDAHASAIDEDARLAIEMARRQIARCLAGTSLPRQGEPLPETVARE